MPHISHFFPLGGSIIHGDLQRAGARPPGPRNVAAVPPRERARGPRALRRRTVAAGCVFISGNLNYDCLVDSRLF